MALYGHALYYPYIHFSDERWLKVAALYYEGLSRIVPVSFVPEDSRTVQVLKDELGFVCDLDPAPDAEDASAEFWNSLFGTPKMGH